MPLVRLYAPNNGVRAPSSGLDVDLRSSSHSHVQRSHLWFQWGVGPTLYIKGTVSWCGMMIEGPLMFCWWSTNCSNTAKFGYLVFQNLVDQQQNQFEILTIDRTYCSPISCEQNKCQALKRLETSNCFTLLKQHTAIFVKFMPSLNIQKCLFKFKSAKVRKCCPLVWQRVIRAQTNSLLHRTILK